MGRKKKCGKADHSGLWFSPAEYFYSVFETYTTLHCGRVHRGSFNHTEMAGSDVPYTSFPGVVLKRSSSSSNRTVGHKDKLEFSPYVYKSAFLLTIVNFLYTSKVCTDDT